MGAEYNGGADVDQFAGFSRLDRDQRYARLVVSGALTEDEVQILREGHMLPPDLADGMIENHIGAIEIPLGVAVGLQIDGKDYVVPMAVEETSVVAAVSGTAKWIRKENGVVTTEAGRRETIGQIQFARVEDIVAMEQQIKAYEDDLIELANTSRLLASMVERGGGMTGIEVRRVARGDGTDMAVVHIAVDTCDAMGANIVTQLCEDLRGPLEEITGEHVTMRILSNYADRSLTTARIVIPTIDPQIGNAIQEASLFAELDPYRAATHNKGIMNGIDPIMVATGNDWRAVEAGAHAYAADSGQYRGLSQWKVNKEGALVGTLTMPMSVGIVGGVTRNHPTAQLALKMMDVTSADELARVATAVGLIQNLGALRALTNGGLVQGHMRLHISNLMAQTDATASEQLFLRDHLRELLVTTGNISMTDVHAALHQHRLLELPS